MEDFIVSVENRNYTYVGHAQGRFQPEGGGEKKPYFNIYVISPCSDWESEDYSGSGWKAEKFGCTDPDVWKDLTPGDRVKLFFDKPGKGGKVQMVVSAE